MTALLLRLHLIDTTDWLIWFVVGLRRPEYESKSDYIWLIVVDAVATDYLLVFLQLVRLCLTCDKSAFYVNDGIIVFVNQFYGLNEFVVATHYDVLDLIVQGHLLFAVEGMELSKLLRNGSIRHNHAQSTDWATNPVLESGQRAPWSWSWFCGLWVPLKSRKPWLCRIFFTT